MNDILEYELPASRTLWHARWLPPTDTCAGLVLDDGKVDHDPAELREWKTERGGDCRLYVHRWRIPLVEGACYIRTQDYDRQHNYTRYATVRGGRLVDATLEEIADILDPAGAESRARQRHEAWEAREYAVSRGRAVGMEAGVVYRTAKPPHEAFIYVTKATAREYWSRRARPEEIAAYKAEEAVTPSP
jgi:hypothetical protein